MIATNIVSALALLTTPVSAQDAEQTTTQAAESSESAQAEERNSDDEVICRRTAVVGSKFKKRICATREEWRTLSRRGSDTTRDFQSRGTGFEPVN